MKKIILILTIIFFAVSACSTPIKESGMDDPTSSETGMPQVNKYTPSPYPAGSDPVHRNVDLDSAELLTMESYPLQFTLVLRGSLPTPCDQLQVDVNPPDPGNKIMVDVYSTPNPNEICVQVLEPFEVNHPLGSFPTGKYTLWVNGEKIAEFQS
jgi:hypothetical protein